MSETTNNNGSKNKAVIILLIILLIGSGGLSFWQYQNSKKLQENHTVTQTELKTALTDKEKLELDLQDLEARLAQLEAERSELANYAGTLEEDVAKLQKTIAGLRSRLANASPEEIARLKKEVEALNATTRNYEAELNELKAENEALKVQTQELSDENRTLSVVNESLDAKVKKASVAQYGPIKIITGRMRKSGFSEETKVRRVEEIRVEIDVIENPIINSASDQSIAIRIVDPEKTVLTKMEENKKLVDKSEIYTIKHTYSFDGSAKKINLSFVPEIRPVKGTYKVEFWVDGALKQTKTFVLN